MANAGLKVQMAPKSSCRITQNWFLFCQILCESFRIFIVSLQQQMFSQLPKLRTICKFKISSGHAFQDSLNCWSLTFNLMMNKTKLIPIYCWQVNSWQQFKHLLLVHLKVFSKQWLKGAGSHNVSPLSFQYFSLLIEDNFLRLWI